MRGPDFLIVLLFCSAVTCAVGWFVAVQRRKRLLHRLWGYAAAQGLPLAVFADDTPGDPPPGPMQSQRLDQLESQLDGLAQQIDRLMESQEFLSRVLSSRVDQPADARMRTPH
jgi:hypothetical protein